MTKRKTKLVYLGWGIVMYPGDTRPYLSVHGSSGWDTRRDAINAFEKASNSNYYHFRRKGIAIAKKLWVEVKG